MTLVVSDVFVTFVSSTHKVKLKIFKKLGNLHIAVEFEGLGYSRKPNLVRQQLFLEKVIARFLLQVFFLFFLFFLFYDENFLFTRVIVVDDILYVFISYILIFFYCCPCRVLVVPLLCPCRALVVPLLCPCRAPRNF